MICLDQAIHDLGKVLYLDAEFARVSVSRFEAEAEGLEV